MNSESYHFPKLEAVAKSMHWSAKEIVRDRGGRPWLLVRIVLKGPTFGHRALEPIVWAGGVRSKFVEIAEDGSEARAYFDRPPGQGVIEFGYDDGVLYRWSGDFDAQDVPRLKRELLPHKVVLIDGW